MITEDFPAYAVMHRGVSERAAGGQQLRDSKAYGVKLLVKTTGFVGLAIAELLAPGSTF